MKVNEIFSSNYIFCIFIILYVIQFKLPLQQLQTYEPAVYRERSPSILKAKIKNHCQSFFQKYSEKYDTEFGRIRLDRIESFKDCLFSCGDYTKGIARIQCSNPECKHEIFCPFSCKRFYFEVNGSRHDVTASCHHLYFNHFWYNSPRLAAEEFFCF